MSKLYFSTLVIVSFFSALSQAKTDIVPSETLTTIKGASVAAAEMGAFAYMAPKYSLTKGPADAKVVADCTFDEDQVSPNGSLRVQHVDVKREKDGSYSLTVPVSGTRGSCEYVLESVYLSLKDGSVDELMKIRSDASVNYGNMLLGKEGPESTLKLEPKATINCEFSKAKKEDVAMCFHKDELLIDDIQIKGTGETFTLDFKDKTKDIFDTVAIERY